MPSGAAYSTAQRAHRKLASSPPQRGQARSVSEDGIEEGREGLHGGRHCQDDAGGAEEYEEGHQPLPARFAVPEPAGAIGDGGPSAGQHHRHPHQLAAPLDHATSARASGARRLATSASPATRRSMPLRRKVEYPSTARLTMGSPARLKLVLSRTGIPLRAPYASSRAWKSGAICFSTVCTRAVPSTWVTAASFSRHSRRTSKTPDMNRPSRAPPGGSSKYRSACSRGTAGAKGRNSSRNLMLRLRRSRISTWWGAARMLRLPSARGPSSQGPCIQP